MEFEHVGKYKDAPDTFTKTEASPETLEVMNQILDQYYGRPDQIIAEGRKKQPDAIRALLDQGPFWAKTPWRRAGGRADLRRRDVRHLQQQLKVE